MKIRFWSKEYNKIICEFTLAELPTMVQLADVEGYVQRELQRWQSSRDGKYSERDYMELCREFVNEAVHQYLVVKPNTLIYTFEI